MLETYLPNSSFCFHRRLWNTMQLNTTKSQIRDKLFCQSQKKLTYGIRKKYLVLIWTNPSDHKKKYFCTVWKKSRHELVVIFCAEETDCVCDRPGGRDWQKEVPRLEEDQEHDQEGFWKAQPGGSRHGDQLWWRLPCPVPAHRQLPPWQVFPSSSLF